MFTPFNPNICFFLFWRGKRIKRSGSEEWLWPGLNKIAVRLCGFLHLHYGRRAIFYSRYIAKSQVASKQSSALLNIFMHQVHSLYNFFASVLSLQHTDVGNMNALIFYGRECSDLVWDQSSNADAYPTEGAKMTFSRPVRRAARYQSSVSQCCYDQRKEECDYWMIFFFYLLGHACKPNYRSFANY